MTWDTTLSLLIGQSHSMRWQAMDLEVKRMVGWAEVIFQDRPDVVQALSSSLSIILNPRVHDTPSLMARLCQDLDALHRSLLQDLSLPPPQTPPPGVRPKK